MFLLLNQYVSCFQNRTFFRPFPSYLVFFCREGFAQLDMRIYGHICNQVSASVCVCVCVHVLVHTRMSTQCVCVCCFRAAVARMRDPEKQFDRTRYIVRLSTSLNSVGRTGFRQFGVVNVNWACGSFHSASLRTAGQEGAVICRRLALRKGEIFKGNWINWITHWIYSI